ncbi:hypothetical protein BaRGS_00008980 [Batillaria attramentaria]|uniref:Uncharacterized protein n=1 Tax=Batillaria attramentaria TaxID=370345 RepID=A0ABD0LK28_9CAEN
MMVLSTELKGKVMPDGDISGDFVSITIPSEGDLSWWTRVRIDYSCTSTDKLVGLTLLVSTPIDQGHYGRIYHKIWRCHGNEDSVLQGRLVRLPLPDDLAFRPSLVNPTSIVVEAAKLMAWIIPEETWNTIPTEEAPHEWASMKTAELVQITPPYSRPYKRFRRRCAPWYAKFVQRNHRFSDRGQCPLEPQLVSLLDYPAVFNGKAYGIPRDVPAFSDPVLEKQRQESILSPQFSLEIWLYILEYCPLPHLNQAKACGIFIHVTWQGSHLTPALLVDEDGHLQVESQGPSMYVAHKPTGIIPRHQMDQDIALNDTDGYFILGGVDPVLGGFLGYMGQVKLYRGRIMTLNQLDLPAPGHPMFQLDLAVREEKCQHFHQWVSDKVAYYAYKAAVYKKQCKFAVVLGGFKPKSKLLTRLLRSSALQDGQLTEDEKLAIAQALMDKVTASVEEHGLERMGQNIPLLKQATCLGNNDAMFTLAAALNNGVGTKVQEAESLAFLMLGVLHAHRMSTLALGHRHMMGIDGVPHDRSMAYMYYKYVADMTRDDRDLHREEEVATEMVRLIDEATMEQQTDESGDLFLWLKHQAQQGVTSAQVQLAHLLFWGSQGVRRNLQAAREFFQQGAAQGDADSMYNIGLMQLFGRGGTEKNESAGKEALTKAAEKRHPFSISALGWLALEKERNYTKAAALFEDAYKLGQVDAGYYLGHLYHWGLYPNKSQSFDTALKYYEWAAVRGHYNGAVLFAYFKSRGTEDSPRDMIIATEWARYMAEKNAVIGQELRAGLHAYREGNIGLAAYHYMLAAEAGPEVASFNLAWLCEENTDGVTAMIGKECQWRHYNLTIQRENQFVDPYSYIKMGDFFWYGCLGQRNLSLAADYYKSAAVKKDPHALFNLAFMLEEGTEISESVWKALKIPSRIHKNNVTLLMKLYEKCRESRKSEAFIPCTLALYRIWLVDLWTRYHIWMKMSTYAGSLVAAVGTFYLLFQCYSRHRQQDIQLYQL